MTASDRMTHAAVAEEGRSQPFTDTYEFVEALRAVAISNLQRQKSGWIVRFHRALNR